MRSEQSLLILTATYLENWHNALSQNHLITQRGLFENSKKETESQERERDVFQTPRERMHRANLAEINQV